MGPAGEHEQEVGICTRISTSGPLLEPGVMTLLVRVFEDRDINPQPFLIRVWVGLSALRARDLWGGQLSPWKIETSPPPSS